MINYILRKKLKNNFVRAHRDKKISSIATCNAYLSSMVMFTKFLAENDFLIDSVNDAFSSIGTLLNFSDKSIAVDYLKQRVKDGYSRSTIELDIQALNCWFNGRESKKYQKQNPDKDKYRQVDMISLSDVICPNPTGHLLKTYTDEQLVRILKHVTPKNALSILLCRYVGVRVKELLTLQRFDERKEGVRDKLTDLQLKARGLRFCGLEGELYTVKGKGGLVRLIMIPTFLVEKLEKMRLAKNRTVIDRGIRYEKCIYDLSGGRAVSQAFSRASKKYLGWNTGVHSLRHDYAKKRLKEAFKHTQNYDLARAIVSQELGHFRLDITDVYLY
jgi:integrase